MQAVERAIQYSQSLAPPLPHAELAAYLERLKGAETALKDFLEDHSHIAPAVQAVVDSWWSPAVAEQDRIEQCHAAVNALPDTSAARSARPRRSW